MKRLPLLLALLCLLLTGCGASSAAQPVLRCEAADYTVDSAQFQYYFGFQYAAAFDTGNGKGFDPDQSLADQRYDETQSWQDFLTTQALKMAEETAQLCAAAKDAGFALPSESAPGDLTESTAEAAKQKGYDSADAYLVAQYGEGATQAGYQAFIEDMALAEAYSASLHTAQTVTAAEIEAFYDSHASDYADLYAIPKTDDRQLDVRVIRFYPDDSGSDADWKQAEERATKVKAQFEASPTDETFAMLANTSNEEYTAPDGGLYQQLSPQGASEALNEWLFPADCVRQAGDYSLLREDDAYALCYVKAVGERPYWQIVAENDLRYENYFAAFEALKQKYQFTQHPENVNLRVPTAHSAKDEAASDVEAVG